jgi:hypothetical protein
MARPLEPVDRADTAPGVSLAVGRLLPPAQPDPVFGPRPPDPLRGLVHVRGYLTGLIDTPLPRGQRARAGALLRAIAHDVRALRRRFVPRAGPGRR